MNGLKRPIKGSVVVITGGASGIGAATAVELGRRGAHIVLADLPGSDFDTVSRLVREVGGEATAQPVDVRDFASVSELARTAVERFGRIDTLFTNAGLDEQSRIDTGDPEIWHNVVETNLLGVAYSVRAFLPTMRTQDGGDILVNASISGREISIGNPLYTASKWGVVGFTQMLRNELRLSGSRIRVTLLEPGLVDTPLARAIPALERRLAAGRALQPEDIARLVAFVVEQPSHVLLHEIRIEPNFPPLPSPTATRIKNAVRRIIRD